MVHYYVFVWFLDRLLLYSLGWPQPPNPPALAMPPTPDILGLVA